MYDLTFDLEGLAMSLCFRSSYLAISLVSCTHTIIPDNLQNFRSKSLVAL
jgi:hypothetical protein